MRHLTLFLALPLLARVVAAEPEPPGAVVGANLMVDPFTVHAKVVLPPPPSLKQSAVALPPLPPPPMLAPAQSLPPGLRAILIRDNGQGLLGGADTFSIPVAHGKQVRIGDQDYHAEVSKTEIKLYSTPKGKLVWEGALGGPAMVSAPVDMSQLRFVPPLSAGVSPGLKSGGGSPSTKLSESP